MSLNKALNLQELLWNFNFALINKPNSINENEMKKFLIRITSMIDLKYEKIN